ncbi:MAG: helix-turn-helix transcriptional regulator [Clostridia bacterium]|nr:helix-turn-helix transcriptional regulator [Clostridia bacterium]
MAISYTMIGRNMRRARMRANMTQAQVAEQLGMSQLNYGRMERAERHVSIEQLDRIAEILSVPIHELCNGMGVGADLFGIGECDLGESVERIASGCSQEARRLMIAVCQSIADYEKRKHAAI